DNIESNDLKKIDKNMNVDVLIVGGGIAGLSTLYSLRNSNLKTILVERNKCGHGVTARSTAKITYLQEKILGNIRKVYGKDIAYKYLDSQIIAMNRLRDIISKEKIDCDLKEVKSYLFTTEDKNVKKIEEEYEFLKKASIDVKWEDKLPVENALKAITVSNTYVFHPLKYLNHLKKKFSNIIYENSKLEKIDKKDDYYECLVNEYKVRAKYVVIASHYPYFLMPFWLPLKSHVETSYIGASKNDISQGISAINIDKPTISFRGHNDYLIYLYNSFMSCNVGNIKSNFEELEHKRKLDYVWSNKDIITNDYMPFIGRIKDNDNTFLMASGFNTWGMTNGTLAGWILSDIIQGVSNKYEELVAPNRGFNIGKLVKFPIDMTCNIKAMLISGKNNVNNQKVIYKKIKGTNVAIYTDEKGNEHKVLNKCPHMKCGVVFNEQEKTWDCLCHGSRFNLDGKCIEGPSNFDISYK
ncbi:MAG: FAD-dependent oxidoreductase, partial [Bacilli bacterium]|nr:FAD-dependent oxidoreductase [Bacilli bacterium]